jgi:signal transduction histidine kinase
VSDSPPELDWSSPDPILRATLDRLPFGVLIYGPQRKALWINRAFGEMSGLSQADLPPGTSARDVSRALHARGWYGGDAAALATAAEADSLDDTVPHRKVRRTADGRRLDVRYEPMPGGGYVVCVSDITSLQVAEAAAARRGALLDTVLSASRSGIAVYGSDQRLVLCNAAYETLVRLPPGTLSPGMTMEAVLRTLERQGEFVGINASTYIGEALAADRTLPRAMRRIRPDGRVLDFASDPLPDGGFVLTVADVTGLVRAEEQASSRAAMLEGVLAALPQGISLFGPDRRARLFNPAYLSIMGDAAVRPGESMADLIARRRAAGEFGEGEAADAYVRRASQDAFVAARRRRRRPDGTTIDVRTAPLPDGGHISVVTDVTLEVAAQAEVQRRTVMMDLMLGHVRHGLMLFDRDDRVVTFNPQAEQLAGIAPGWLKPGTSREAIIDHLHGQGVYGTGEAAKALASRLRAGHPLRIPRIERTLPDGRVIEQQSDPTPDGGYVLAIWDVTWRRQTEAALHEAKNQAEEASRAKSRFLASMSHELRTPLNAIIGFSEAIAHDAAKPGLAEQGPNRQLLGDHAQAVNDAGRHLLALINDILDVARIESGRVELADAPVDPALLLAACRRLMEPAARAARITLAADIQPDLPMLRGDERRLRQVLLNLLSNAVKFTPPGGSVQMAGAFDRNDGSGGSLVVMVSDTGAGIAPEDLPKVFEPFNQLGEGPRRAQGSGLGLFMSRALAKAHGGTLELDSAPGHGTVATLRLPPDRLLVHPQPTATMPAAMPTAMPATMAASLAAPAPTEYPA